MAPLHQRAALYNKRLVGEMGTEKATAGSPWLVSAGRDPD
jgi:hypothetical protein